MGAGYSVNSGTPKDRAWRNNTAHALARSGPGAVAGYCAYRRWLLLLASSRVAAGEQCHRIISRRINSGKKHRGAPVRKSERGKTKRILYRWRIGPNPDRPFADRGPESDQPHFGDAVQERSRT